MSINLLIGATWRTGRAYRTAAHRDSTSPQSRTPRRVSVYKILAPLLVPLQVVQHRDWSSMRPILPLPLSELASWDLRGRREQATADPRLVGSDAAVQARVGARYSYRQSFTLATWRSSHHRKALVGAFTSYPVTHHEPIDPGRYAWSHSAFRHGIQPTGGPILKNTFVRPSNRLKAVSRTPFLWSPALGDFTKAAAWLLSKDPTGPRA
jgi:hypothetical protein